MKYAEFFAAVAFAVLFVCIGSVKSQAGFTFVSVGRQTSAVYEKISERQQPATVYEEDFASQQASAGYEEDSASQYTTADSAETPALQRPESVLNNAPVSSAQVPETAVHEDKNGYALVKDQGKLRAYRNGRELKNTYLAILKKGDRYRVASCKNKKAFIYRFGKSGTGTKFLKNKFVKIEYKAEKRERYCCRGKVYSGWLKKGSAAYYYVSGRRVQGWQKIKKKYYYFSDSKEDQGKLRKNCIVYGKEPYYVDADGVRVTSRDIRLAVSYVVRHSERSASPSRKLRSCYIYMVRNSSYQRFYGSPAAEDLPGYGLYMLSHDKGNCYRFATAFAYIAKVLGYESRVAVGNVFTIRGGMSPHGWTEVKAGGRWYMYDADMENANPGVNFYMRTEKTYSRRHNCLRRYTLTVHNGKARWSRSSF